MIFSLAFALSIDIITSAVNVAFSLTSIATVPGDETLTVRVAPEPPLAESERIVPAGIILVCATPEAPAPCAVAKVSAVALAIAEILCVVVDPILIKSPTLYCVVNAVPLPVTAVDDAPTVTVPVNAEVSTFAPALLTTTM